MIKTGRVENNPPVIDNKKMYSKTLKMARKNNTLINNTNPSAK